MAITETLKLADEISGPAQRMARAVGGLEGAIGDAQKATDSLAKASGEGVAKAQKAQVRALDAIDRARAKVEAEQKRQSAAVANDQKRQAQVAATFEAVLEKKKAATAKRSAATSEALTKVFTKKQAEQKKAFDAARKSAGKLHVPIKQAQKEAKKLGAKDALGAFGLGGAVGSGILTGVAAMAGLIGLVKSAVSGAIELARGFGEAFIDATNLRGESKALMDTLTGGRGGEALALLKKQAIALGEPLNEVTERFKRFRDAGADNKQAIALENLRGDIRASGKSAEEADSAIGKMLGEVKAGTKDASKGASELAVQFGVAGDGMAAVNKQQKTFNGLTNRLRNAPGNLLDSLAAGPAGKALDELGSKAQKALNEFLKSDNAGKLFGQLEGAITGVADAIGIGLALIGPFWEGFMGGIGPVLEALSPIGDALSAAFGGDSADQMDNLKTLATALGVAFGVAAVAVGTLAAAVGAVLVMTGGAIAAIGALIAVVLKIGTAAVKASGDFIIGLVNGIRSGSWDAVKAVKDLASGMISAFTGALKIGSPSKVMEGFGKFTAQGVAVGMSKGATAVEAAARGIAVSATPQNDNAAAATPSRSVSMGGVVINISLNGSGANERDAQNIAEKVFSILEGQLLEAAV